MAGGVGGLPAFGPNAAGTVKAAGVLALGGFAHHLRSHSQERRQLPLRVEDPPLNRSERDRLGGGDLVVFPLLKEAQRHD